MTRIDIVASKHNEAFAYLNCEPSIKEELNSYFSFFAHNYKFHPLFKKKVWNGKIYLYSKKTSLLYTGLLHYLKEFSKERGYTLQITKELEDTSNITPNEVFDYAKSLNVYSRGSKIEPRDYQLTAFYKALKYKKILLLSPTASGKSLIIYMILRHLLENDCERGLLVVPTISLVEQMFGDFKDYSSANGWDVELNCQKIYQGQEKRITKKLTISTWQSIFNFDKEFFEQFDFVIGDEAHGFKAKSLTAIMTKLINAKYRIGTTGTIDDAEVNKLTLEGHFGRANKVITTKELIDKKQLTELEIKCLILKYPQSMCQLVKDMDFQKELDFIVTNNSRNKFIANLTLELKGNSLILFQFVDKHGKVLHNIIKDKLKDQPNRKIFFVCGETEAADREAVRHITENEHDAIIVASFGVFSTGVNIRRLHNIIFASPSKSKIRNLQSIGRVLRLGEGKEKATLYDISDDLRIDDYTNYTMNHYAERVKIYHSEKFKVMTYKVDLKNE